MLVKVLVRVLRAPLRRALAMQPEKVLVLVRMPAAYVSVHRMMCGKEPVAAAQGLSAP